MYINIYNDNNLLTIGIADDEMEDLLSLNDDVLTEVFEWWENPIRRIPSLLWIRIITDLLPFLANKSAGGSNLYMYIYYNIFINIFYTKMEKKEK